VKTLVDTCLPDIEEYRQLDTKDAKRKNKIKSKFRSAVDSDDESVTSSVAPNNKNDAGGTMYANRNGGKPSPRDNNLIRSIAGSGTVKSNASSSSLHESLVENPIARAQAEAPLSPDEQSRTITHDELQRQRKARLQQQQQKNNVHDEKYASSQQPNMQRPASGATTVVVNDDKAPDGAQHERSGSVVIHPETPNESSNFIKPTATVIDDWATHKHTLSGPIRHS